MRQTNFKSLLIVAILFITASCVVKPQPISKSSNKDLKDSSKEISQEESANEDAANEDAAEDSDKQNSNSEDSIKKGTKDYEDNAKILGGQKSFEYVYGTTEIPLISGLKIIEEESTSYDATDGTITVAAYSGKVTLEDLKKFYLGTMPQLGYKIQSDNGDNMVFNRKDDVVDITIYKNSSNSEDVMVKFIISSR